MVFIGIEVAASLAMVALLSIGLTAPNALRAGGSRNELVLEGRSACLCEQRAVGDSARAECRRGFENHVAAAGGELADTACAPISTSFLCFGTSCIATAYHYVGVSGPLVFCDQAQAAAVDRTFNRTYERTQDATVAAEEADRVAKAVAAGLRVNVAKAGEGCVG